MIAGYSELECLSVDEQRRIGFTIAMVAEALEIPLIPDMPLAGLLDSLLAGAMETPHKVSPDAYECLFRLRGQKTAKPRLVIVSRLPMKTRSGGQYGANRGVIGMARLIAVAAILAVAALVLLTR
jgi:hypothetical protein